MKITLIKIWKFCLYVVYGIVLKLTKLDVKVMSIDETVMKMKEGCSIVRFGDGEFFLIAGKDKRNYQNHSEDLVKGMVRALSYVQNPKFLVCLPETLCTFDTCKKSSKKAWTIHIGRDLKYYKNYCKSDILYGNAFVSRPYMIYKNKDKCKRWFSEILSLFENKEFVLIEGKYSRLGVGNDLFDKAKSLHRILCPPKNAYDKYEEILSAAKSVSKDKIILLSIGPASKPLAYDLFACGYTVWDLGHLDSEYEWFLNSAETKVSIPNKHTAETADNSSLIGDCKDSKYLNSIITEIY